MVSSATLDAEIGAVVIAIFVVLVFVYMLYRYLRRRGPELAAREGKSVLDDRSYNQIRIGQAAADRLAQTGVDVTAAKEHFRRAEAARAGGNYDVSIEHAKKGQDSLAAARSASVPLSRSSPARPISSLGVAPSGSSSPGPGARASAIYADPPTLPVFSVETAEAAVEGNDEGAGTAAPAARPPKNKMEAHFQLSLIQDELDQARATKSGTQGFRDAESLRVQGQAAYDTQDYTEALRLALKSRRTLGTRIEALPLSTVPASKVASSGAEPVGAAARDTGSPSGSSTFGQKCAKCGRISSGADQFCRECGAPIAPAVCSRCAAPLLPGDRFCGKCGATQT